MKNILKKINKNTILSLFFICFFVFSIMLSTNINIANAAPDLGMQYGTQTGLSDTDPKVVIARLIQFGLGFLAIIAVVLIIYAGFLWMTASGREDQVEKAKTTLKNATIGLIIILSALGITTFLLNGINSALIYGSGGGGGEDPVYVPDPPVPGVNKSCGSIQGINNGVCDNIGICTIDSYCDFNTGCYCLPKKGAGDVCGEINAGVCSANNNECLSDDCDTTSCLCNASPVITSITPYGGFCTGDINTPCNNDNDCGIGDVCDNITPNGAIGNFISIKGNYFGDGTGNSKVYFEDNSGSSVADSVVNVNPLCTSYWSDTEIIVVVPSGNGTDHGTSSIKVVTSNGLEDKTNDDKGNIIPDFVINNIVRPGICKINPENGKAGDNIDVYGNNFNVMNSEIYFGNNTENVQSDGSSFSSQIKASMNVPLISTGTTTTFIINNINSVGVYSNFKTFTKNSEANSEPYISYFEPMTGNIGQYVTIYGGSFGNERGASTVKFENTEASYIFPLVCADTVWNDNQIIVKVPDGIADGDYKIKIKIASLNVIESINMFTVDSSKELLPSLCKINPTMGPNNIPVSMWGEYFGTTKGEVKFYYEKIYNSSSGELYHWGYDSNYNDNVQKISTKIHEEASTGPIKVKENSGSGFGNGMYFKVGMCNEENDPALACGQNICCMDGFNKGACVLDANDCNFVASSSVYEWEFTTKYSGSDYGSCEEYRQAENECLSDKFCPNAPGNCSFNKGGTIYGQSCDCNNYGSCDVNGCKYEQNLDRCVYQDLTNSSDITCTFSTVIQDVFGNDVTAYCNDVGQWYYSTISSCINGWQKNINGDCVETVGSCIACNNGKCIDSGNNNGSGVCVVDKNICDGGICNNQGSATTSDDVCEIDKNSSCECCCRKAEETEDCCTFVNPYTNVDTALTCEGSCGSYTDPNNTEFGRCTGCTITDNNGVVDQSASDDACNCLDTTGKYCDTSGANGQGVCMECGGLPINECSNHMDTCCVDAGNNNLCIGGTGNTNLDTSGNNIGYCSYYQCTQIETGSGNTYEGACSNTPVKGDGDGEKFKTKAECNSSCSSNTGSGAESSCYDHNSNTCSINCIYPNYCIGESGGIYGNLQGDDDTCKCCCNPNLGSNDECAQINPDMKCTPDMGDCTGPNRGLCCGCESDYDCSAGAETVGCGNDTCCHARPNIYDPDNNTNTDNDAISPTSTNICTNIEVKAIFDTKMNITSFKDNFILVGQFNSACPDGTDYLTSIDKNFVQALFNTKSKWNKVLDIFTKNTKAASGIYCKVKGKVDGYHDNDNKRSILIFNPSNLLSTNTTYFAIIKGDEGLNSETGVLSSEGIGMNGGNTGIYNGIEYKNSYIWSFTTIDNQGDNGACEIDHVDVTPDSYLFKTTKNDLNENDTDFNDPTYDTVSLLGEDRDKVFKVEAKNEDGQTLSPIVGVYDWTWIWDVDDTSVIKSAAGADDSRNLISAVITMTDGKAVITVTANMVTDLYNHGNISGTSNVWVFTCNNPWPAYNKSANDVYTWAPWSDNTSCIDDSGNTSVCDNMNYELYYCKDNEEKDMEKSDDLPTILNNEVSKDEYTPLICSDGVGNCIGKSSGNSCTWDDEVKGTCYNGKCTDNIGVCATGVVDGTLCTYNGTCNNELKIKKESYFFREDIPDTDIILNDPVSAPSGESINLKWTFVAGEYSYYTLYYGVNSGNYTETIDHISVNNTDTSKTYNLPGLEKNKVYYFRIGGNTDTSLEKLSEEKSVETKDITAPGSVTNVISTAGDKKIYLKWEAPIDDDLAYFEVKYVAVANNVTDCNNVSVYADSSGLLKKDITKYTLTPLSNEVKYCIAIIASDQDGNKSNITTLLETPTFGIEKMEACSVPGNPIEEGGRFVNGNGICTTTQEMAKYIVSLFMDNCSTISGKKIGGEEYKCRIGFPKYELPVGWSDKILSENTECVDNGGKYNAYIKDGEEYIKDLLNNNEDVTGLVNEKRYMIHSFKPLFNPQNATSSICKMQYTYSLTDTKKTYTVDFEKEININQDPKIENISGFSNNQKRVGDVVLVNADISIDNLANNILNTNTISIKDANGKTVGIMNSTNNPNEYSTTFQIESVTDYFIHAYAYNKNTLEEKESIAKIDLGDILPGISIATGGTSTPPTTSGIISLDNPILNTATNKIELSWNIYSTDVYSKYFIDYGNSSGQYTQSIDTGSNTSYVIDNITQDGIYYISIRGIKSDNSEVKSNEVSINVIIEKNSFPDQNYQNSLFKVNTNSYNILPINTIPVDNPNKVSVLIILDDFSGIYKLNTIGELTNTWKDRLGDIIGTTANSKGILSRDPFQNSSNKFEWYITSINSNKDCFNSQCDSSYANSINIIGDNGSGNYTDIGTDWADKVIVLSDTAYNGYAYRSDGWAFASGADTSYITINNLDFGSLNFNLLAIQPGDNSYELTFAVDKNYCDIHYSNSVDCSKINKFQVINNFDPDPNNNNGDADLNMNYSFNLNSGVTSVSDFIVNGNIFYNYVFVYEAGNVYNSKYPMKNITPALVVSHEFGHSFGLLLDEYVTGDSLTFAAPNCSTSNVSPFTESGCFKSTWYRSSSNSIMRELGFDSDNDSSNGVDGDLFNTVSIDWMQGILDCFGGTCANKCDICDISSLYFDDCDTVCP